MALSSQNNYYKKTIKFIKLVIYYFLSIIIGIVNRRRLNKIKTFCLFIGHGRSGHSIVGALLDAHPDIIISDEADSLGLMKRGFTRNQVLSTLLLKSQWQAYRKRTKSGLGGITYSYFVPGQWQGKYQRLKVIGDSKAGVTVGNLAENSSDLENFKSLIRLNIKIFLVLRNPYDNISTMVMRGGLSINRTAENYFKKFDIIQEIYSQYAPDNLIIIRHEELIEQPKETLQKAACFLGLEISSGYLDACESIIFKSPSKTRNKILWDDAMIETVKTKIDHIDLLSGYSFFD